MQTESKKTKRIYTKPADINPRVERLLILEIIRIKSSLSKNDLGKLAGFSSQLMMIWYDHDDMKLSYLMRIAEAVNIKVRPEFVSTDNSESENTYQNDLTSIRFNDPDGYTPPVDIEYLKKKYPPEMVERFIEGGKTKFVADLIISKGDTITRACRNTGSINPTNLKHWFKVDDIMISKLYTFAKTYGMKLHWELSAKEK